jgi:hypothetical protein
MADGIIIKENKGKLLGTVDKRKSVSAFNAAKHLRSAELPALCNDCIYRSIDSGGNGKCPKYELDASCAIREDIQKVIGDMDTRDPEQLKGILDYLVKLYTEQIFVALGESKMDGNIPDRNTNAQLNSLLKIINTMVELSGKVEIKETQVFDEKNIMKSIFKEMTAKKSMMEDGSNK